ncbi:vegetative incompatibility protein HET-E-1 [Spatholobus suberectus]|nr:vegetative incompatibility protein HET-E-1 [Spatholobus suberectus]
MLLHHIGILIHQVLSQNVPKPENPLPNSITPSHHEPPPPAPSSSHPTPPTRSAARTRTSSPQTTSSNSVDVSKEDTPESKPENFDPRRLEEKFVFSAGDVVTPTTGKCLEKTSNTTSAGLDGLVFTGSVDSTVKIWQRDVQGKGTKHLRSDDVSD